MRYSIKIFICIVTIFSLGFFTFSYWVIREVRGHYSMTIEDSLVEFSNLLGSYLSSQIKNKKIDTSDFNKAFLKLKQMNVYANIHGVLKGSNSIDAYVTNKKGVVIFDSRERKDLGKDYSQWNDVYLTLKGQYGARSTRIDPNDPLTSYYFVAAPINLNGEIMGAVTVIKPEQSLAEFIRKSRAEIILVMIAVLLMSLCLAALFSYWLAQPINALTRYTQLIIKGNGVRSPRLNTKEFKNLAHSFEEMRISLEGKKSVENYVQSLVHELKSPLTAILGAAEILRDKLPENQREQFIGNIEEESKRARRQLDELLVIASLESKTSLDKKNKIDLNSLFEELESSYNSLLQKKNLSLNFETDLKNLSINGDRSLFYKAMSSLLMNAIEFSPLGGKIEVEASQQGKKVKINVRDQGQGIPAFAKDKVFQKFYSLERPESGRKSTGLGLSFAREVVQLHGGSLGIEDSEDGWSGANFVMTI